MVHVVYSPFLITAVAVVMCISNSVAFRSGNAGHRLVRSIVGRSGSMQMMFDPTAHVDHLQSLQQSIELAPHWAQLAVQGIADEPVCPAFGQPGWAPFCFLQGNPVFNTFDAFQMFIQNSIVSLHDFLADRGLKNAYGPSIILFTVLIRMILLPLNFQQIASTQRTQQLNPLVAEIREKYTDKNVQNQMVALLYQETKVNPLAGCLPALFQIPVFLSLYRSFFNLASQTDQGTLNEPFLWLPNLQGPVFGVRSTDWLLKGWENNVPTLGWHDTLAYLSIPVILYLAQAVSLRILTPPSDDPTVQRTQTILKYLPLMVSYFSLSVPSGLGLYWVTQNILSTVATSSIKAYVNANPMKLDDIDLDKLANSQQSVYYNPQWGYSSEQDMLEEAKLDYRPPRRPKIPVDFV